MNRKLNDQLNKFLAELPEDADYDKEMAEFIKKYNGGELEELERTSLDDAYDLLEEAQEAETYKEALKLAEKAYKTDPACLDAALFIYELDEPGELAELKLRNAVLKEEKRLIKEGYFDDENIGHFYGIFETRPYLRGLHKILLSNIESGKMKKAIFNAEEIIELNEHDNMGVRYILMGLYAFFEDEEKLFDLRKRYEEDSLSTLIPEAVLYYKKEDKKNYDKCMKKINKANKHFIKMVKDFENLSEDDFEGGMEGYFQPGAKSEVLMVIGMFEFLFVSTPGFMINIIMK